MLLGLLLLVTVSLAWASGFVTERAWVEDPTGQMTLAEAQRAPETPFANKYFTQGFSQSTFWLRLHIDPAAITKPLASNRLIIRIRPPIQDQIQLFDPLHKDDEARLTGDYFDWETDEYQSLNLNYVIPVGQAPRDVWLRLRTNQSTLTVIEVMTVDEVRAADRRQEMGAIMYLAMLVICMGWGVLSFIIQRDRLVGMYIGRELLAIIYGLVMLGYFRALTSGWLPAAWLDPISNTLICLFVTYVIWFDSQLIRQFKPNPWLYRATLSLMLALPVEWALQLMGKAHLAIMLNSYIVFAAILLVFITALSTRAWRETRNAAADQKPVISKTLLVGTYVVILIAVLFNRLPAVGLVPMQEGLLYLNLVYALVSSVMMMILVLVRAYRLNQRQQNAQKHLEMAQLEIAREQARRVEQSNFLKMLAHEMKTPLSVVRMAVGSEYPSPRINDMADRAVRDMNGIIERLLQVEKLHDDQLSIQAAPFDLIKMVYQLQAALPNANRLQIEAPAALRMESDARFVQIILSNLIDNAVKYSPSDSVIVLKLGQTRDAALLRIENDIGAIDAPDPNCVFDKYYRSERAQAFTGSGLGLYLVKVLADMLSGQVRCILLGQRICFELVLPLANK
ncbi:ATP-binding protein [Fluviibacter phosphoraccumulans]|uniref:sensor histidine kinase n=1 Tax=Fluviibacter phosphoraccumulans TaxID=1751046 RepID=UPI0013893E53|nr:ATP-binding protein [Fluviibacter phosphoraccumulans]